MSNGFLDPLIGMKTIVDVYNPVEISRTLEIGVTNTRQTTTTYAPQYSMQYTPQLILSSPQASISGSTQAPQVTVIPTATPTLSQAATTEQTASPVKPSQDNTLITVLGLGAIAVLAYYFITKKRKASARIPKTPVRASYRSG